VFPEIEVWQTNPGDMVFVCSRHKIDYSVPRLREKLDSEPYKSAFNYAWGIYDLEGFLAHYMANSEFVKKIAETTDRLNTDDRMLIEFGFARSVGRINLRIVDDLRQTAYKWNLTRPELSGGEVDWDLVEDNLQILYSSSPNEFIEISSAGHLHRMNAYRFFKEGNLELALEAWGYQQRGPLYNIEYALLAEALADKGYEQTEQIVPYLRNFSDTEADVIMGRYYFRKGDYSKATQYFESGFVRFRKDPWASVHLMRRALNLLPELAKEDTAAAEKLFHVLVKEPFSVFVIEEFRQNIMLTISQYIGYPYSAALFKSMEPNVVWQENSLQLRYDSYKAVEDPLADKALRDLEEFKRNKTLTFEINENN
jgi:hypothetical protein